jgi:hypothetical protein
VVALGFVHSCDLVAHRGEGFQVVRPISLWKGLNSHFLYLVLEIVDIVVFEIAVGEVVESFDELYELLLSLLNLVESIQELRSM